MSDCIFCKIVAGEIPSVKIREDENFLAILDAFPACEGHTIVMPKRHLSPDIFTLEDTTYTELMLAVKKVIPILKKGLLVSRVGVVVQGMQVDHAHVKLYPFRGGKSFVGGFAGEKMASPEDLQKVADEILGE